MPRSRAWAQNCASCDLTSRQVERLAGKRQLAAFDLAHVQNVVDQQKQVLRRGVHLLEARSPASRSSPRLRWAMAVMPHDAVQRRADLVGHARKELAFRPAGLARLGKRLLGPVAFLGQRPLRSCVSDDRTQRRQAQTMAASTATVHEAARRRILRHDASPGRPAAALPSAGVGTHGNGAGRRVLLPRRTRPGCLTRRRIRRRGRQTRDRRPGTPPPAVWPRSSERPGSERPPPACSLPHVRPTRATSSCLSGFVTHSSIGLAGAFMTRSKRVGHRLSSFCSPLSYKRVSWRCRDAFCDFEEFACGRMARPSPIG